MLHVLRRRQLPDAVGGGRTADVGGHAVVEADAICGRRSLGTACRRRSAVTRGTPEWGLDPHKDVTRPLTLGVVDPS